MLNFIDTWKISLKYRYRHGANPLKILAIKLTKGKLTNSLSLVGKTDSRTSKQRKFEQF